MWTLGSVGRSVGMPNLTPFLCSHTRTWPPAFTPPLSVHPKHRLENISRLVEEVSRIERQFKGAVKLTVPWYSEAQLMVSPILKQAHVVTKAEFFYARWGFRLNLSQQQSNDPSAQTPDSIRNQSANMYLIYLVKGWY